MSVSYFAYLAQLSYLLAFVSYTVRSTPWLRGLAVLSSFSAIVYGFSAAAEPLWVPIAWNALFASANIVHLLHSRWRGRDVRLDPLEDFLAKTVLANFPPAEVRSFAKLASDGELPAGAVMIRAGVKIEHLFCLLKGTVDVMNAERRVAELGPGRFVGEMSLLTRTLTRADVVAETDLKLLVWSHASIESWVSGDASRLGLLQAALGTQVVEELLRQQAQEVAS